MLKILAIPLTAGLLALCTGCYHAHVVALNGSSVTAEKTMTVHTLYWGLTHQPTVNVSTPPAGPAAQPATSKNPQVGNCPSNAIHEVTVHSNLAYSAATVLTLGFWAPLKVAWTCAPASRPSVGPQSGT